MAGFQIDRIADGAWSVLDAGQASFYVLEGTERAAVIDTGITMGGKIMPVIRGLTDKPLVLVITHAHIDHFHHMDEFDTVYMSHREFEMPRAFLEGMFAGKHLDLKRTIDITTGSVIDLGGDTLEICAVPGHTPGSVAVLDTGRNIVFTGDAIGSGSGVLLQLEGCVPLTEYLVSLRAFLKWLVDRGGAMRFYGGHHFQPFTSRLIRGWNPLSMGLLCDLIDLTEGVVNGTIVGRPCDERMYRGTTRPLYATYGRAELMYSPESVR